MPPVIAAVACVIVILLLLRREIRDGYQVNGALWLPFIWLIILGSRPLSFWLGTGGGGDIEGGNAFDRNLYLGLTAIAVVILNRRQVSWSAFLQDNKAVVLMYGYLLVTCVWSDYPFVTFKRWFKDLTAISIVLIIISSLDPRKAIQAVFSWCAAILFFLSVLFIKYYPELGRVYAPSGGLQVTGVTTQKNTLGEIVLIFGLVLIWRLLSSSSTQPQVPASRRRFLPMVVLIIGTWLLWTSDSKTSLICLIAGIIVLFSHKLPFFRHQPKYFVVCGLIGFPTFFVLNELFGISGILLELVGRDATFTGRTGIWDAVKEHPTNPLVGSGYLMYWDVLGPIMIGGNPVELKTAHNGYLDVYLDGGIIGLIFLAGMILSSGALAIRRLLSGTHYGRLCFAFFIVLVLANMSESSLIRRSPLWFTYLLFCLDYSRVVPRQHLSLLDDEAPSADEPELEPFAVKSADRDYR